MLGFLGIALSGQEPASQHKAAPVPLGPGPARWIPDVGVWLRSDRSWLGMARTPAGTDLKKFPGQLPISHGQSSARLSVLM